LAPVEIEFAHAIFSACVLPAPHIVSSVGSLAPNAWAISVGSAGLDLGQQVGELAVHQGEADDAPGDSGAVEVAADLLEAGALESGGELQAALEDRRRRASSSARPGAVVDLAGDRHLPQRLELLQRARGLAAEIAIDRDRRHAGRVQRLLDVLDHPADGERPVVDLRK
jgi:hypothetical protein